MPVISGSAPTVMKEDLLDYFEDSFDARTRVVAVRHYAFESEARLYEVRLKNAGIPCFLSNANVNTAFPLGGGDIGLHVRHRDQSRADELLRAMEAQMNAEQDFRDADEDDIAFEKAVHESHLRQAKTFWWIVGSVVFLVVLYRLLRTTGALHPLEWF